MNRIYRCHCWLFDCLLNFQSDDLLLDTEMKCGRSFAMS